MRKEYPQWSLNNVMCDCEQNEVHHTDLSGRYTETTVRFQQGNIVNGTINTLTIPHMEISRLSINSTSDWVASQHDGIERCVSTFVCKGQIRSTIRDYDVQLEQEGQNHSFVHLKSEDSQHRIGAGHTSVVYINFDPVSLTSFLPESDWKNKANFYKRKGSNGFYVSPSFSLKHNQQLNQTLFSLVNHSFKGDIRSMFVESKAIELVALQLEQVKNYKNSIRSKRLLCKSDIEKLMAVKEFIDVHYLDRISLFELSRKFLLNEFKLKTGFQQLFHQATFNYIHSLRMHKAKELLTTGVNSVSEVSDAVGYSSHHNFSNAFMKHFGYRPSKVL